ncbi:hypothetical protein LPJ66_002691 [Kickxella alabastrina]|uniref:Uncharacterized protein n=1 Tax=Kickxella alabastrina TaxID=61397 RepID=A0ACC1IPS6_9FUNG|nr:hypothetical protein LPJ66_002691 [Kickxella alabastrina]
MSATSGPSTTAMAMTTTSAMATTAMATTAVTATAMATTAVTATAMATTSGPSTTTAMATTAVTATTSGPPASLSECICIGLSDICSDHNGRQETNKQNQFLHVYKVMNIV